MYIVQTRILIRINCDRTGSVSDAYFPLRAEVNGCVFQISIPSHSRKIIQKTVFYSVSLPFIPLHFLSILSL